MEFSTSSNGMNYPVGTLVFSQLFQLSRNARESPGISIFQLIVGQIFRPLWCSRHVCSADLGEKVEYVKDTRTSLQSTLSKTQPNCIALHSFSIIFSYKWAGNMSMYSMKSMFPTNEKLSLTVEWSSWVSISCIKVQNCIGHLVWIFDSGNSIVSRANF